MSVQTQRAGIAIVTGGSSGIGRAIAVALVRSGWNVAFSHVGDDQGAEGTLRLINEAGGDAMARHSDVGIKAEVVAFHDAVANWRGPADLLVNNAGVQTWAPLLELCEKDWDRVIQTNLKGCFLNTQVAGLRMRDAGKGGTIVNIGSGCNKLAFPKLVDYTASKGGIEQFTKSAAVELGPLGIRVNCVAPGAILSERTASEAGDYAGTWSPVTPLRRIGVPEDVADAVTYLASPGASFITGQTIYVDGGAFSQANWPYPLTQ